MQWRSGGARQDFRGGIPRADIAGLDGAFKGACSLRGDAIAEVTQLDGEYAPEPLFNSGSPETASAEVIRVFFENYGALRESRDAEARRFATKLGVALKS